MVGAVDEPKAGALLPPNVLAEVCMVVAAGEPKAEALLPPKVDEPKAFGLTADGEAKTVVAELEVRFWPNAGVLVAGAANLKVAVDVEVPKVVDVVDAGAVLNNDEAVVVVLDPNAGKEVVLESKDVDVVVLAPNDGAGMVVDPKAGGGFACAPPKPPKTAGDLLSVLEVPPKPSR